MILDIANTLELLLSCIKPSLYGNVVSDAGPFTADGRDFTGLVVNYGISNTYVLEIP